MDAGDDGLAEERGVLRGCVGVGVRNGLRFGGLLRGCGFWHLGGGLAVRCEQELHDVNEVRAVVEQTVFAGGFFFLAVDAKPREQVGANHLQVANFVDEVGGDVVVAGEAPLVVHHDGNAVFFRAGLDLHGLGYIERDWLFEDDEARFCADGLEAFGQVRVFVYGDGDYVGVHACVQLVAGGEGLRVGNVLLPEREAFCVSICGGDETDAPVFGKRHGV